MTCNSQQLQGGRFAPHWQHGTCACSIQTCVGHWLLHMFTPLLSPPSASSAKQVTGGSVPAVHPAPARPHQRAVEGRPAQCSVHLVVHAAHPLLQIGPGLHLRRVIPAKHNTSTFSPVCFAASTCMLCLFPVLEAAVQVLT